MDEQYGPEEPNPQTADEFETAYARRTGITVQRLRELGRTVRPCDCEEASCQGWQSMSLERAARYDAGDPFP